MAKQLAACVILALLISVTSGTLPAKIGTANFTYEQTPVPYVQPPKSLTISISSPENKTYNVNNIPFDFSCTVSKNNTEITEVVYYLDGSENSVSYNPFSISSNWSMNLVGLSEGTHTIRVFASARNYVTYASVIAMPLDIPVENGTAYSEIISSYSEACFTIYTPPSITASPPKINTYGTSGSPSSYTVSTRAARLDTQSHGVWSWGPSPKDWIATQAVTFDDENKKATDHFETNPTETRFGNVALGFWADKGGFTTSPNMIPIKQQQRLMVEVNLTITNLTLTSGSVLRSAIVICLLKATEGAYRYVELDFYDSPQALQSNQGNISEGGDVVYNGSDVVEFRVDQLPTNESRHYTLNFQDYIQRAWGIDENDQIAGLYLVIESSGGVANTFEVEVKDFVLYRVAVDDMAKIETLTSAATS